MYEKKEKHLDIQFGAKVFSAESDTYIPTYTSFRAV